MSVAPLRIDETESLAELQSLQVLDTSAEPEFDALVQAAAHACNMPIALVSLIDSDRQWFKAKFGYDRPDQTPRDLSFCAHAVLGDSLMVVADASQDRRFATHPMVLSEPHIRFYAGAPLLLKSGVRIGTLCVMDRIPRQLDASQREALEQLSTAVACAFEGRAANRRLAAVAGSTGVPSESNDPVESALNEADSAMSQLLTAHQNSLVSPSVVAPLTPHSSRHVAGLREERTTSKAMTLCLTAATALLSIVRRLLRRNAPTTPAGRITLSNDLADETKIAGRSAYEAGLLLTDPQASDSGQAGR